MCGAGKEGVLRLITEVAAQRQGGGMETEVEKVGWGQHTRIW